MKKFCKTLFAVAGIMVIVGAITILAAIIVYNRSGSIVGDVNYTFIGAGGEDIKSLHCITTYGKTTFKEGSEWSVTFNDVYLKGASCGVNGDTLYVKTEGPGTVDMLGWKIGLFFDFNKNRSAETIITYPAGIELDNVFGEAGIGRIDIDSMNARTVLIQSPFCGIDMTRCSIKNRLVFDSVIGNIDALNNAPADITVDLRMGRAKISGNTEARVEYGSNLIIK